MLTSATATTKGVGIVSPPAARGALLRVMFTNNFFFVFRKLEEGELEAWLQERSLPWVGGTVPTLDPDAMAKAYPYLSGKQQQARPASPGEQGKDGGGWKNPFGW